MFTINDQIGSYPSYSGDSSSVDVMSSDFCVSKGCGVLRVLISGVWARGM